jgi:pimeloyl-ACP methyl ester carboxylesterase
MADDALSILDAYRVERAHLLGGSMGGMIVQEFALRHPTRVRSLITMMSTPLSHSYASGTSSAKLPGPDETAWKAFATVPGPGTRPTREQYVEGWTAFSRGVAGSIAPFDADGARRCHRESFDRASDISAVWNHLKATQATPDRLARLGSLNVPTLVVHGSEDHVIPVSHGHAIADCVPGAKLIVIEGLGHQFDPAALSRVAEPVLDYLATGP